MRKLVRKVNRLVINANPKRRRIKKPTRLIPVPNSDLSEIKAGLSVMELEAGGGTRNTTKMKA